MAIIQSSALIDFGHGKSFLPHLLQFLAQSALADTQLQCSFFATTGAPHGVQDAILFHSTHGALQASGRIGLNAGFLQ
jgi:hypothetical protein